MIFVSLSEEDDDILRDFKKLAFFKRKFNFLKDRKLRSTLLKIDPNKSHSTLRAKRTTFGMDKSSSKMPKITNLNEFLNPEVCCQKVLPDILGYFQTLCSKSKTI